MAENGERETERKRKREGSEERGKRKERNKAGYRREMRKHYSEVEGKSCK